MPNPLEFLSEKMGDAWMVPEGMAQRLFFMKKKKFYLRVRVLSNAKTPFSDAIREMKKSAYKSKSGILYAALSNIDHRLGRGRSIDEALAGWIPQEERMLLSAGDKRGYTGFSEAIDQIMELNRASGEMIKAIVSGLIEPTILITGMYFLMLWMATNFNAKAIAVTHIKPSQLSGSAHQFYEMGVFASTPWAVLVPVLLAAFIGAVFYSMPRWTKPAGLRRFFDKIPPYSIYRSIVGARWMMAFATLGMANIPYEIIFFETSNLSSPWLKTKLDDIAKLYRRGLGLGQAFFKSGHNFPSKVLCEDLVFFGDRPEFEKTLLVLSDDWVKSTNILVKVLASALTAVGYMVVGFGMLWMMSAFQSMQTQLSAIVQHAH
jgi:hypothetical protein